MTKRAQQFEVLAAGVMDSGSPIATGYVRFYEAGTTTLKNAYADKDKGSSFTKLALDADSRGVAYGDGIYKLKFYAGDPDDGGTDTGITIDNYKCTAVMGAIRTVTSADDIDRDDELVLVDTTSDDITVTLDDVDTFDNPVTIKKIAAGNTVTIATTDSQNIDSDSTKTLTLLGSAITVYPDTSADLWRVQNPVVSELTATATEINTACDGITATASEINTACDGITKTAAELNLTGSAGTFVNEANDQPVAVTGEFDIDSSVVETAWESVGPTGAGADNTWTALDSDRPLMQYLPIPFTALDKSADKPGQSTWHQGQFDGYWQRHNTADGPKFLWTKRPGLTEFCNLGESAKVDGLHYWTRQDVLAASCNG
jgi:hypothetical protein